MSDKIFVTCPNCNASFETEREGNSVKCKYCGSMIPVEEKGKTAPEGENLEWDYYDPKAEKKKAKKLPLRSHDGQKSSMPDARQRKKGEKRETLKIWGIAILAVIFAIGVHFLMKSEPAEDVENIDWSNMVLGEMLPEPPSLKGTVYKNDEEYLSVTLKDISNAEYREYVDACSKKGFTIETDQESDSYDAFNADGYELYLDFYEDEMDITLDAPEEDDPEADAASETQEAEPAEAETESQTSETNVDGIRPEFKSAMDSYEAFMDEYCAFMQKYADSDGTDMNLLADYTSFMTKYAEVSDEFAKWEDQEINAAETAYYLEVQTRVNQKLAAVAYN